MDLKYITPHQRLHVLFEGKSRDLQVTNIAYAAEADLMIEDRVNSLTLEEIPYQIALINWETQVALTEPKPTPPINTLVVRIISWTT